VSDAVRKAMDSVRQGDSLAAPLSREAVFPPMVVRMIGIGERSGSLDALLEKISEFYDQQVEAEVKSLTSLIEPLLIAVMGIVVGGIVLAIFLPIMKLQEALTPK
jgi:type IV pilus assembly protein PilC